MDRSKEIKLVSNPSDILEVVTLADEIWREHYTPIIGIDQVDYMLDNFQSATAIGDQISDGAEYYLISYNGKPCGYFSFYPKEGSLFLSKIYVKNSLRGKGLGSLAIDFIEEQAAHQGLSGISLTVNKNNRNSIAAYRKMGFEIIKPVVMDIGGGFIMDDYYMKKKLSQEPLSDTDK